jgi:hypothetical protein
MRVLSDPTKPQRLNIYTIAVCDTGGGKTPSVEQIIQPVLDIFVQESGLNIIIRNLRNCLYTDTPE